MKYKLFFILIITTAFLSCKKSSDGMKKNQVVKDLPSFQSLYDFTNKKNGGSFLISENTYIGNTNDLLPQEIVISGGFKDPETKIIKKGGKVKFGETEIEPDSRFTYSKTFKPTNDNNIYGKKINVRLELAEQNSNTRNDGVLEGQTTSPLPMRCSDTYVVTSYNPDGSFVTANNLYPNAVINWNLDQTNTRGVFIYIEYNPDDLTNLPFKNAGYTQREGNAILVDDDGSATLLSELFADIPVGAQVTMYIGRGNFEYLEDSKGDISNVQIYSLTYQYGAYRYQPPH